MNINSQSFDIPVDSQQSSGLQLDLINFINEQDFTQNQKFDNLNGNSFNDVLDQTEAQQLTQLEKNREIKTEDLSAKVYDVDYELSLEDLTMLGVDFKVENEETRLETYRFSEKLNKVFASIDNPCTFGLSFKPQSIIQLIIRVMLVCTNSLNQPLSRCGHHTKNDNTEIKNHLVLRKDGPAEYVGTPEGQAFRDRLALKIPMGNSNRKNITLEFKCLTSCLKIRNVSTALVFTLEDPASGELLGRKILPIKVSRNFKRDMETAEKANEKWTNKTCNKRKQSPVLAAPIAGSSDQGDQGNKWTWIKVKVLRRIAPAAIEQMEQICIDELGKADPCGKPDLEECLENIRRQQADK